MPALPLDMIGWLFALLCGAALAAGALVIVALHRAGELERRYLSHNVLSDMLLFAIWMLGLIGSVGLLLGKPWSRQLLEYFCWVMIPLAILSGGNRLYAVKREAGDAPVNWVRAAAGVALVVVPLVLLCSAAIVTLRG
jgi:hypothetical protein